MKTTDSHDSYEAETEPGNASSYSPTATASDPPPPPPPTTEIDPRAHVALLVAGLVERGLLPILDEVSQRGHVTREEILGKSRARHIVRARQELWWCLRQHTNTFSLHEIGKMFQRHHTSVLAGVRAHEAKLERMQRRQSLLNSAYSASATSAADFDLEATPPPSVH